MTKSPQISSTTFILPTPLPDTLISKPLSDNDLQWEYIVGKVLKRKLRVQDLNFEELDEQDDTNITTISTGRPGPPPPPPPMINGNLTPPPPPPPPPPMMGNGLQFPFLSRGMVPPPPTMSNGYIGGELPSSKISSINKSVKTVRLHWRETVPNPIPTATPGANDSLWTSLNKVKLDTDKLAQLFELKQAEVKVKVIILKRRFCTKSC